MADLQGLAETIKAQRDMAENEEAAKQAFVMPLIEMLGYNPRDLTQVRPEYAVGVGGKREGKVDYAILSGGKPVLLVEVKKVGEELGPKHLSQLFHYFVVVPSAKFAALTNGIEWQFFSDLSARNRMDEAPFLEIDLSKPSEDTVHRLRQFAADRFNPEDLHSRAIRMRDVRAIKAVLEDLGTKPDRKLVALLARHARPEVKNWKPKLLREIREATTEAFKELFREHAEKPPDPPPSNDICWFYDGGWHPEESWAALYRAVVRRLYNDRGGIDFYKKLRELVHVDKLGHIGPSPADAGGKPVELPGGWWLNINLSQDAIRKKVKLACEAAGLDHGRELVVK